MALNITVNNHTHEAVVFGYGSLMSAKSRSQQVSGGNWQLGILHNFRRRFNATGMSNSSRNYKYFVEPSTVNSLIEQVPNFNPVFLNIHPEAGHSMVGCYFPVTSSELRDIKAREANYHMVDVTDHVDRSINLRGLRCIAAVARPSAQVRTLSPLSFIASPYWETCLEAHKEDKRAFNSWERDAAFKDFAPEIIDVALPQHLQGY